MIYLAQKDLFKGALIYDNNFSTKNIMDSMISNGTIWFILAGVIIIIVAIIFAVKKRGNKKETN